jgi:hypothetical protein
MTSMPSLRITFVHTVLAAPVMLVGCPLIWTVFDSWRSVGP